VNLAFPALLIVILILPGVIARFWYRKGTWEYPVHVEPFAEQVFQGLIWAAALHFLWCAGAVFIFQQAVDIRAVLTLLAAPSGEPMERALASATSKPIVTLVYFVSLYLFAGLSGYWGHLLVRRTKLDRKLRFFQFENEWHYVLSGEYFVDEQEQRVGLVDAEDSAIDVVQVSAVAEVGGDAYLYTGRLRRFFFDREGVLDRLVLTDTFRRKISADRESGQEQRAAADDERFYKIEGDYFVIRYGELKNLNIGYWKLMKVDDAEAATETG